MPLHIVQICALQAAFTAHHLVHSPDLASPISVQAQLQRANAESIREGRLLAEQHNCKIQQMNPQHTAV